MTGTWTPRRGWQPASLVADRRPLVTRAVSMQRDAHRVAKFMVRYDGPYKVTSAFPDTSSYTLDLPPSMRIFPTFHADTPGRALKRKTTNTKP